jgi:hypothetical protein
VSISPDTIGSNETVAMPVAASGGMGEVCPVSPATRLGSWTPGRSPLLNKAMNNEAPFREPRRSSSDASTAPIAIRKAPMWSSACGSPGLWGVSQMGDTRGLAQETARPNGGRDPVPSDVVAKVGVKQEWAAGAVAVSPPGHGPPDQ